MRNILQLKPADPNSSPECWRHLMLCKLTSFLVYLQLLYGLCRDGRSCRFCAAKQEGSFPPLHLRWELVALYLFLLIRTLIQETAKDVGS